ncbi:MAG: phosphate ABC transporter substrate-binding protein PstS [Solirubrobacteraceae bacterium]
MNSRSIVALAATASLGLGLAACGSSSSSKSTGSASSGGATAINGAGSTFAQPIYDQWGSNLKGQGVTLNYQPIGSGAGVAQFTAGTVDFGASDPPLKDPEVKAASAKGTPVHIPTVLGAITASYNLQGVKTGLKLDGPTLVGMFLGKITKWNDAAITKLNPGIKLPPTAITIIHRSDSSGTTKGFTGFLAAVSPAWKSQVGSDKDVKWPTGTGAKGNAGVAAAVKQTDGAVGYVEAAYALANNFTVASVKNKAGQFVAPTLDATTAAADGLKVPADLRFTISNPTNPAAYPISSQTFIIVYKDLCKAGLSAAKAKAVVKLINYGLGAGQDAAKQLQYAPLPAAIQTQAKAAAASLQCNGAAITG